MARDGARGRLAPVRMRAGGVDPPAGSLLQNRPTCNGWTFWHYELEGALKPIDAMRQTWLLATQP